ncbi:MAG: hypothetical protein NC206_08625 [Bacteroides sp.]|nr:hypothetical protein [Roseburia sp.]MCM1347134.1 hypothetical protein [Bacteroides sp.]MCM1421629.1 hypothetical protein [Bacteroides sp.]
MRTKRILGIYAPLMITTVFISAITFTGCSQDDEIDECEETYKTYAEMMMTRAGENNQTKPEKPKQTEFPFSFKTNAVFEFSKGNKIRYGSSEVEITIYLDSLDRFIRFDYTSKDDSDTKIANVEVMPQTNRYDIKITASYLWDASYSNGIFNTTYSPEKNDKK